MYSLLVRTYVSMHCTTYVAPSTTPVSTTPSPTHTHRDRTTLHGPSTGARLSCVRIELTVARYARARSEAPLRPPRAIR